MAVRQPSVIWAQRESFLYVTIEIDDVTVEDLTADNTTLHFRGKSHTEVYETTLEFYDEIVGSNMKRTPTNTRVIELNIPKKESVWWPRLLKQKEKVHWLKVDFDKWKDEDDSGAEDGMPSYGGPGGGFDFDSYMNSVGGGASGAPDFDGLDDESDADMPELEDDDDEDVEKSKKKADNSAEKNDGAEDKKLEDAGDKKEGQIVEDKEQGAEEKENKE